MKLSGKFDITIKLKRQSCFLCINHAYGANRNESEKRLKTYNEI